MEVKGRPRSIDTAWPGPGRPDPAEKAMSSYGEFRQSYWRYCARHVLRILSVFALGAFVFFTIWVILEITDRAEDPTTRAEAAMAIAIVVSLAAVVMLARHAGRETPQDPHLMCPQCHCPLVYYDGIIVLTSGNCPHCGQQVLDG
jgi:hypothetical protein